MESNLTDSTQNPTEHRLQSPEEAQQELALLYASPHSHSLAGQTEDAVDTGLTHAPNQVEQVQSRRTGKINPASLPLTQEVLKAAEEYPVPLIKIVLVFFSRDSSGARKRFRVVSAHG
jgi:hypothetical protein